MAHLASVVYLTTSMYVRGWGALNNLQRYFPGVLSTPCHTRDSFIADCTMTKFAAKRQSGELMLGGTQKLRFFLAIKWSQCPCCSCCVTSLI